MDPVIPPGDRRASPGIADEVRPVDYRELMKKVEETVDAIERADELGATIHTVADEIIGKFREELGLYGGRLYERRGRFYVLEATFGEAKDVPRGLKVPISYGPTQVLLEEGSVYMEADDPLLDKGLEEDLGVDKFAAIEVGDERFVLAFNVAPGHDREDVLYSLGILRHAINQKIRHERITGIFQEARKIQASILPRRIPAFAGFDIAGHTEPLEIVGGDFYDYIPITDKILGLAIADVSGHGLPAALQVRDIYMGLRMGLSRDFKIIRTVERLNAIIHGSTLTSRFVSMFYGELEPNGIFIYVNAGHPPPYHLREDGTARALDEGGAVLGPLEEASYERGYVTMRPGDLLLLYTDGILEARGRRGGRREEYGSRRLLEVARAHRREPAQRVTEAIFTDVAEFSGGRPAEDDRTVVVVKYPQLGP